MKILIPAYYLQDSIWAQTYTSLTAGDIAIINPSNGVGTAKISAYANVVTNLNAKSIIPAGYVYTSYGTRDAATVKAEVDNYFTWYGIKNIFSTRLRATAHI